MKRAVHSQLVHTYFLYFQWNSMESFGLTTSSAHTAIFALRLNTSLRSDPVRSSWAQFSTAQFRPVQFILISFSFQSMNQSLYPYTCCYCRYFPLPHNHFPFISISLFKSSWARTIRFSIFSWSHSIHVSHCVFIEFVYWILLNCEFW